MQNVGMELKYLVTFPLKDRNFATNLTKNKNSNFFRWRCSLNGYSLKLVNPFIVEIFSKIYNPVENWKISITQCTIKWGGTFIQPAKGQLISKCLFGVFNFSQKTNVNKSTWGIILVKSIFFRSFFGKIEDTKKSFWN